MAKSVSGRVVSALLAGLCMLGVPASGQEPRELLRPGKESEERPAARRGTPGLLLRRSRLVEVDRESFLGPADGRRRLHLELFPGTEYTAEELRGYWSADGSTYLWVGRIEGMRRGHVILAATGEIVSGNISTDDDGFFLLRHLEGDLHVVEQAEARPNRIFDDAIKVPPEERPEPDPVFEAALAAARDKQAVREAAGDTQIDVLVAYTARVRNQLGSTSAVLNKINLTLAEANQGMVNSGVPIEFRLVYSMEVSYPSTDETASSGLNTALSRLRNTSDGYLDDVAAARNQYGADMVSLWIHGAGAGGGTVGLGYQLQSPTDTWFPSYAYSVVEQAWAAGPGYAFAHELGHNMGAAHDRAHADVGDGAYDYAYGYQWTGTSPFGTIMAYPCANVYCPGINYWSNPSVSYQGHATGISSSQSNSADNAQALRNTRAFVATYRPTATGGGCTYSVNPTSVTFSSSSGSQGIEVTAGSGCAWSASTQNSWITFTNGSGSGNGSFSINVASTTSARTGSVTVGGQIINVTQSAPQASTITVTVTSSPAGLTLTVDGSSCAAPCIRNWTAGSSHSISAATQTAAGGDLRYAFQNWSQGGSASQTVSPSSAVTYTANFQTQYRLTTSASPSGSGSISVIPSSDGYVAAGTTVQLSAAANSGYQFTGWSGTQGGSSNPLSFIVGQPSTVIANFAAASVSLTLQTLPAGLPLTVDGQTVATPYSPSWTAGSSHVVSAPGSSPGAGTRYQFISWSNSGPQTQTITAGPGTLTANFQTQYLLTRLVSGSGSVNPNPASADGYYASGTNVQLTAAAGAGAQFSGWAGDATGSANPTQVLLSAPRTVTAVFAVLSACNLSFDPQEASVAASGDIRIVRVKTGASCTWSAIPNGAWITVLSGATGIGNGTIRYQVAASSGAARNASITAGGTSFNITQAPANCSYSFSGPAALLPSSAGSYTVSVQTQGGCAWLATSNSPWLTLGPSRSGVGAGSFTVDATANSSWVPRPGSLVIAGQSMRFLQHGTDASLFTDTPPSHPFFDYINFLGAGSITTGCNGSANSYCPESLMTRSEMAAFIVRSLLGENFTHGTTPYFSDVPASHPAFRYIQKLRELGVTNGCTASTYCPDATVTRGQMAAFLVRALLGISATDSFPYPPAAYFTDVTFAHPFYAYIQKLRELGITAGCTASSYCSEDGNTRGQMAVFVTRGFF